MLPSFENASLAGAASGSPWPDYSHLSDAELQQALLAVVAVVAVVTGLALFKLDLL
ncbi:MAG: hypothetical protein Q8Q73_15175 [Stagnimonas sp.]|nr:hypothetical protein [Stagnimonas sp.]